MKKETFLSSGADVLNLGCAGTTLGAFIPGHYYYFVGDSQSGKTFCTLTMLAEAIMNSYYDNYQLIYDNPEDGALMSIKRFFGKKLYKRMEAPYYDKDQNAGFSRTVEDFYFNAHNVMDKGPCIYIVDSIDALSAKDDDEHFEKRRKASNRSRAGEKAKEIGGSYGMAKPKQHSMNLRHLTHRLTETKSILIMVGQTRQNIGMTAMFEPKTRGGGTALTFYATLEMWSSTKEKIKRIVGGKKHIIGTRCKIRIKKNRVTGRDRSIYIDIYNSVGIDNTGTNIRYLINQGYWKGNSSKVAAPEFEYKGSIEGLVTKIEEEGEEMELRTLVASAWNELEEKLEVRRKKRYS